MNVIIQKYLEIASNLDDDLLFIIFILFIELSTEIYRKKN